MALLLGLLWLLSWLHSRWPELESAEDAEGVHLGFLHTTGLWPLPFFVYVCETVQACEAWSYKCGAAVDLLQKLNSRWKGKPRHGKNKYGEREQDKEEVRGPEGTACSLVKSGVNNLNWRQCFLSFSSHCCQTIDIFMNLQIIKFKRTKEKHYLSGVVELKENSGLQ